MKYFIQNCNLLFFIFFIVLLNSCNGNRNNKFEPSNGKTIAQRIDSFVTKKINISAYKGSSKLGNWKPDTVVFIKELDTEIYLFYRFNFPFDDLGGSYKFSVIHNKSTCELFFQPFLFENIELNGSIDSFDEFIPSGINSYLSSINFNKIRSISFLDTLITSVFLNIKVDLTKTDTNIEINRKLKKIHNPKKLKNVYYINNKLLMVKLLGFKEYKTNGTFMNYFKHEPKLSILIKDVTKDFIK